MYGGQLKDVDGNTECISIIRRYRGSKGANVPPEKFYKPDNDPFYPGEDRLEVCTIGAGLQAEDEFKFEATGRLRYWYKTDFGHINFAAYFVPKASDSAKRHILHPEMRRCTFNVPERGELEIPGPGTVLIEFSNEASWFYAKTLHYYFQMC